VSLTQLNKFKIVFSDFDGTLTFKEGLSPVFFEIINLLESKKIPLVIVTGRSLSWGHFLLTHFPFLQDVIVEGGGAIVSRSGKFITEECLVSESNVLKLADFVKDFAEEFPNIKLSVDSFGRKTDRAIELHDLQDGVLFDHIEDFLKSHHINFSTSNVHLNFWCGEVSKYMSVDHFLKKHKSKESDCVFFGDSLNDQAMFKSFHNSVGVSNIVLEFKPTTILKGDENIGPFGVLNYLQNNL
jgi:HAD superfamily hydrolase (TIGR01484 family)